MLFFILLILGFAIGGGGTPKADLVVDGGGDDGSRWVMVTDPANGRTAFGMYRTGAEQMVFRSECWAGRDAASDRVNALLEMPWDEYAQYKKMAPGALGAAVDCGPKIARRLLAEFEVPSE